MCRKCEVPVCRDYRIYVTGDEPSLPPKPLPNDVMIFYAPREIYTEQMTVMEMTCASTCVTSMI